MDDATHSLVAPGRRRDDLAAGTSIGDWRIVRALASGGFGTVYEVRHAETEQRAALKLLHAHLAASTEMLSRFDRETRVIAELHHPNIVDLVDAGFSRDGQPYLCMELLEGDELGSWIARRGRLSSEIALAVLEPLCEALATAHERGIVHRDVKASNIVICRGAVEHELGRVVLLDFGIAKISDALASELTATHQSIGTPSCMAPEQIHGHAPDPRTDVYALGGLLFHMLTGHLPFEDPSPTMTQYLHLHARRPRASIVAQVPERLDDVIGRAMAITPAERFPDAVSLLAAARAAVRDPTVSRPATSVEATAVLVGLAVAGPDLDEALLTDLESILPAAERVLVERGFGIAVELGTSAIFVKRFGDPAEAIAAAIATWDQLEQRPRRDPRVQIGIHVHRGAATFVGGEVRSADLLRPATWGISESATGVWVTRAIDPAAPQGGRLR